jgi:hypothetical protein
MSETRKDKVTDDDPRLRGHALQDHDRVKAELENHPDGHSTHHAADQILKDRDEALDEVRAVRDANEERTRRHSSVEHAGEIAARSPAGNDDVKPVSVVTADGRLYINSHGEKVLDRDGIVDLQRHLAAAFQAVS